VSIFNLLRAYVKMLANNTYDPKTVTETAAMTAHNKSGGVAVSDLALTAVGQGTVEVSVPNMSVRLCLCTNTVPTAELAGCNAACWPPCSSKSKRLGPFSISAMQPRGKTKTLFRKLKPDCSVRTLSKSKRRDLALRFEQRYYV
jgi:hypothetical protein